MKNSTNDNQVVTKKCLKNELSNILSNYPTKQDLKNELSNYPTKQDLKREVSKLKDSDNRIVDALLAFRDDVNTKFFNLDKKIERALSILEVHTKLLDYHRDLAENLDYKNSRNTKRIEKLENKVFGAIQIE